jgi:hypothetical protein
MLVKLTPGMIKNLLNALVDPLPDDSRDGGGQALDGWRENLTEECKCDNPVEAEREKEEGHTHEGEVGHERVGHLTVLIR